MVDFHCLGRVRLHSGACRGLWVSTPALVPGLVRTEGPQMRSHATSFCLGVSLTSLVAFSAHAGYDVTVLQNVGVGGLIINLASSMNAFGQTVGYTSSPAQ
jgi:hypothetical protein